MSKVTSLEDPWIYTIPEAARLIKVSTRQMYNIALQQGFPVIQISPNRKVIPKAGLEAWLKQRMKGSN